jgi:glycosyltransferase involved in cell wall biosynthesis
MKYPFQLGLHYDETIYAYGFNQKADQKIFLHDSFTPVRLLPFSLTTEILQASDQAIPKATSEHAVHLIQRWKQVPGHIAILSVARPEKMTNSVFLERLSGLLSANPESHFFWCGKKGSADVDLFQRKLEQHGLQSRSSLLGWVQPWPVIKACDYFLDTYPFGSGITMAQALRHGKPIITHIAAKQHNDALEKTLVEEPNFNQLLTEDSHSNILLLDSGAPPRLQAYPKADPGQRRNTDPFAPNPAVHQLLSQRLLGSRAGEQP